MSAELLLRVAEPIQPSADLRTRIMAQIAQTPQDGAPPVPTAELGAATDRLEPPRALPAPRRPRFGWRDWGLLGSVAAALYFGYWSLRLQGDVATMSVQLAQQEALVRAATSGRVVRLAATPAAPEVRGAVAETAQHTLVYLENLPTPTTDRAYQVWLIPPGGQPIGAGVSAPGAGGSQTIPLDRPLTNIQTVAVTQEPAGGSMAPTSDIVAAARL
jgi:hypothetical protein